MKSTNNNGLMNEIIANNLIQDLFSYLFYLYLTSQIYEFCYLVFISITALSTIMFSCLLAKMFYFLLVLMVLLAAIFNFLSVAVFCFLSALIALSATVFRF